MPRGKLRGADLVRAVMTASGRDESGAPGALCAVEVADAHVAARLTRRAATLSVAVAVSLATLKLVAAMLTGSLAVLASVVDSLADVAASAITWLSVRVALRPADPIHRYGHGKAEALSALVQAALVAGSGVFVLIDGVRRLLVPAPIEAPELGFVVMGISLAATVALVLHQRRIVRITRSQAIAADSAHYLSDISTNLAVLLSLALAGPLQMPRADPAIAAGIASWLLAAAWRIGRDAIDTLMDRELDGAERARIEALVRDHPMTRGLHDLRTRSAGRVRFIELHLELDGHLTLSEAHRITDAIEQRLRAAFADAEVVIHQEPVGLADDRLDHRLG